MRFYRISGSFIYAHDITLIIFFDVISIQKYRNPESNSLLSLRLRIKKNRFNVLNLDDVL